MRSVRIPKDNLLEVAKGPVLLLGDAAHAMPIFAGEGGNHGLLDGVAHSVASRAGSYLNIADSTLRQIWPHPRRNAKFQSLTTFSRSSSHV